MLIYFRMFRQTSPARQSSQEGDQTRMANRISNLFNNNPLFNTKPNRNPTDTLEEEDECSQDSYTADSPVHNMNEKELVMEAYMGYFIGAVTVIFLSILIFGYVKTTEIPLCMCLNATDTTYVVEDISAWNDICLGGFSIRYFHLALWLVSDLKL